MLKADDLLKPRKYSSDYQPTCPIHISIGSCKKLFQEAGLKPDPAAIGTLGDILENFAISLLKRARKPQITKSELAQLLRETTE